MPICLFLNFGEGCMTMSTFNFKKIKNLSDQQLYKDEGKTISQAMAKFENLSCAEITKLLDETCTAKRILPWEYRRAYRIRDFTAREREKYYANYSSARLKDGHNQVQLLQDILNRIGYHSYKETKYVLDIGTGRGGFLAAIQKSSLFPNAQFEGIDTDMASLIINHKINEELENENYSLICYSGGKLPFNSCKYDLILSFSTLEHVGEFEQQFQLLEECCRCLKTDGVAILSFSNKLNIVSPEEHIDFRFFNFLPHRFKDIVSYKLRGMPSSDIYPLNIFTLKRALKKIKGIDSKLHSRTEFKSNRLIKILTMNFIFRIIAPEYVLIMRKHRFNTVDS